MTWADRARQLVSNARQHPWTAGVLRRMDLVGPLVLTYHRVVESRQAALASASHAVSAEHLRRQIERVGKSRRWVSLPELLSARVDQQSRLAAMVFDDGHESYLLAHELLLAFGVRPTIAIVPTLVMGGVFWRDRVVRVIQEGRGPELLRALGSGERDAYRATKQGIPTQRVIDALDRIAPTKPASSEYMTLERLRSLGEQVDFTNHSASHPVMASLPAAQQIIEVSAGRTWLAANLPSASLETFVVPFGGPLDWNDDTRTATRSEGIRFVLTNSRRFAARVQRDGQQQWITRFMPHEDDFAQS
jgi:hypothetical protein